MLRKKLVSLFIFSSFFSVNFINQNAQAIGFGDILNRIPGVSQVNQAREAVDKVRGVTGGNNNQSSESERERLKARIDELDKNGRITDATTKLPESEVQEYLNTKRQLEAIDNSNQNAKPESLQRAEKAFSECRNQEGGNCDAANARLEDERVKAGLVSRESIDSKQQAALEAQKQKEASENAKSSELKAAEAKLNEAVGNVQSQDGGDTNPDNDPRVQRLRAEADALRDKESGTSAPPQATTVSNSTGNRADEFNDSPVSKAADKAAARIVADETPASIAAATQASGLPANKDYGGLTGGYKGNVPEGADITGGSSSPSLNKGSKINSDSLNGYEDPGKRSKDFSGSSAAKKDENYAGAGANRQPINGDDNRSNSDYDTPDGVKRNSDGTVKYDTANKSAQKDGYDTPDGVNRNSDGTVKYDTANKSGQKDGYDTPDGVNRNSDGTVKYDTADKSGQKDGYDTPDGVNRNPDGTVKYDTANKSGQKDGYDTPDGVNRNSDGTVKYDTANKSGQKDGYDTPDGVNRNSDGTVKYDTANKPGSDSGGSGKGRVVDGDWFPGSLNGSKGGASSASGGVARASKSAVGSSGGAAGSLGGGSFGSAGELGGGLSDSNLSVGDAAKFGLSQYNLIDPNPSKMTFRNLEMAKYMPGLIQGAMSGNLKGAVGGAVGGMAGGLIGNSLGSGVVSQLAQGAASGGVSSAISGGNPLGGAMNGVKGAGLGIAKDTVLGAMNNVIPSPNIGTGLKNVVDSTNCFTTGGCIKSPREFATNMGHNTLNSLSNGGNATSDQAISDEKTIQDAKALSNAKNVNRPVYLPNSQREKDLQAALARTGQEYPTVRDDYARRSPNINQPSQPSGFTGKSVQSPGLDKLIQRNQPSPTQPSEFIGTTQNSAIDRIPRAGTNKEGTGFVGTTQNSAIDRIPRAGTNNRPTELTGHETTGTAMPR